MTLVYSINRSVNMWKHVEQVVFASLITGLKLCPL